MILYVVLFGSLALIGIIGKEYGWAVFFIVLTVLSYNELKTDKEKKGEETTDGDAIRQRCIKTVRFTMGPEGKSYSSYSPIFYRIVETVAMALPRREMEAVVIVQKTDNTFCSLSCILDLDHGDFPDNITFGSEFIRKKDTGAGASVSCQTAKATGFITPQAVKNTIDTDMASSVPGLQITPTETTILTHGDFAAKPLVSCRYKVKYTP